MSSKGHNRIFLRTLQRRSHSCDPGRRVSPDANASAPFIRVHIFANSLTVKEVVFYRSENGMNPIEEFLDPLSAKHAKRVAWVLQLFEDLAIVPIRYFKKLEGTDDTWEVRIDSGSDTFRLLGFLDRGNLVILTNGFAKKTKRTPQTEIALEESRKRDWLGRNR